MSLYAGLDIILTTAVTGQLVALVSVDMDLRYVAYS